MLKKQYEQLRPNAAQVVLKRINFHSNDKIEEQSIQQPVPMTSSSKFVHLVEQNNESPGPDFRIKQRVFSPEAATSSRHCIRTSPRIRRKEDYKMNNKSLKQSQRSSKSKWLTKNQRCKHNPKVNIDKSNSASTQRRNIHPETVKAAKCLQQAEDLQSNPKLDLAIRKAHKYEGKLHVVIFALNIYPIII